MALKIVSGLASIKVGAVAGDGGMGTSLAALGETYQDSCTFVSADPEKTEHYSEESDDAFEVTYKLGLRTLKWSIFNFDADQMVKVLGGTVTGTSPKVWNAPAAYTSIEQSIEITDKKGNVIQIPRAKIAAKLNISFGKKNVGLIDIEATVLVPTKAGTASVLI